MSYQWRKGNHLVTSITTGILGSAVALSAIYVMLRTLPELVRYLRMRSM